MSFFKRLRRAVRAFRAPLTREARARTRPAANRAPGKPAPKPAAQKPAATEPAVRRPAGPRARGGRTPAKAVATDGPKILQIGFNLCGTRTMAKFFEKNRVPGVHWEKGAVALRMQENLAAGRKIFAGYEDVPFISDTMNPMGMPIFEGHFLFRKMYEDYPDAYFILNTRPVDKWIASRLGRPAFVRRFQEHYNLGSAAEVEVLWRRQWDEHHADVLNFFADKTDRLLVLDIEKQGGEELAAFLSPSYDLDPRHWGHVGKSAAKA